MDYKVASIFFILLAIIIGQTANAWDGEKVEPQAPSAPSYKESSAPAAQDDLGGYVVKAKHHQETTSNVDRQEVVILNTEKGFVPANVRLHKGLHYVIHIVNVNEKKKNVSFIMDAFNEHQATYYGQVRSFNLDPDHEGIFDYECPETTSLGKLVIFGERSISSEAPPSEEK